MKKTKTLKNPLVSIIMPVYNAGLFLWEALESVFNQTYENIEVIAVNDGSTDNSWEMLKEYAKREPRLHIFSHPKNQGVGYTANFALKKAKGKLVARMDADDIMPSQRIEKQVDFLSLNPQVVVVGGQVELVTEDKRPIVAKHFPLKHSQILNMAFVTMPIQQGSMMVKKSFLPKNFIWYKTKLQTSEDLDLFFRLFQYGDGANLPDILLFYRQHGNSLCQATNPRKIFLNAHKIRQEAFRKYNFNISRKTLLIAKLQYFLVKHIPESWIYPIYYLWRGMLTPFRFPEYGLTPLFRYVKSYIF